MQERYLGGNVPLHQEDLDRLDGLHWLSDNIIFGALRQIESIWEGSGVCQDPVRSQVSLNDNTKSRSKYQPSQSNCSHAIHVGDDHWTLSSLRQIDYNIPMYIDARYPEMTDQVQQVLRMFYPASNQICRLNPWYQEDTLSCGHRLVGWAYLIALGTSVEELADTFFNIELMPQWVKALLEDPKQAGPPPTLDTVPAGTKRVCSDYPDKKSWLIQLN